MTKRERNKLAAESTLRYRARAGHVRTVPLVAATVMIFIAAGLAVLLFYKPRQVGLFGPTTGRETWSNAAAVASAIRLYHSDTGVYPSDLSALAALPRSPEDQGPWIANPDLLKDKWGRQLRLIAPGQKNMDFDVVCYGADNKPGGSGEDADIIVP